MGKKNKDFAKDDLIDHLLDDANKIAGGSPSDSGDASAEANPWDALEQNVGHVKARQKVASTYEGPSASGLYQNSSEIADAEFAGIPIPVAGDYEGSAVSLMDSEETVPLEATLSVPVFEGQPRFETPAKASPSPVPAPIAGTKSQVAPEVLTDDEATVPVDAVKRRPSAKKLEIPEERVVVGAPRGGGRTGNVFTTSDASLAQSENLKAAQQRILELERENDRYRQENEEISSAADIIRGRLEEMNSLVNSVEREKADLQENLKNEIMILKGNLQFKDSEVGKARLKNEELEVRLRNDFRKIRVKERELENRLELARAEKIALIRAKDENILELKRKIDQLSSEIDNYREKCQELNKTVVSYQEQFRRTVRALRLALTNLEVKDENLILLKKAD